VTASVLALLLAAGVQVEVVQDHRPRQVDLAYETMLVELVEDWLRTCNFNSVEDAGFPDPALQWNALSASPDRFLVSYDPAKTFDTTSGRVVASQILLAVGKAYLDGPLVRRGDTTVAFSKCSGGGMLRILCTAVPQDRMPESGRQFCTAHPEYGKR